MECFTLELCNVHFTSTPSPKEAGGEADIEALDYSSAVCKKEEEGVVAFLMSLPYSPFRNSTSP